MRWVEGKNELFSINSMFKCWILLPMVISLETSFGSLRYSLEYASLLRRKHGEWPQLLTRFRREEDPWLIDALFAKEKKKQ